MKWVVKFVEKWKLTPPHKHLCTSLHKQCPYSELFWFAFSLIRTEYGVSLRIQSECGKMRTNTNPKKDTFHALQESNDTFLRHFILRHRHFLFFQSFLIQNNFNSKFRNFRNFNLTKDQTLMTHELINFMS